MVLDCAALFGQQRRGEEFCFKHPRETTKGSLAGVFEMEYTFPRERGSALR